MTPPPFETSSNMVYIVMENYVNGFGNKFDLNWLQIPKSTVDEEKMKEIKCKSIINQILLY